MSWKRISAKKLATAASRLGVPRWLHKRRQKRRDFRVFILEYHAVSPEREEEGTVSTARFREHLVWLREREWARTGEDVLWRRTKLGLRLDTHQAARVDAFMHGVAAESPSLGAAAAPG